MPNPGIYILRRVKGIGNIERPRRRRHQLHQPHGALTRHRIRIEIRFDFYHGPYQAGVDVVPRRRRVNRRVNILLRKATVKVLIILPFTVEV